jgi:putative transposase
MRAQTQISERRACSLMGLSRTVLHYQAKPENETLRQRLVDLSGDRRRFGYRRLRILLEREGFEANHKRVYRLYREAGLAVRRRKKRERVALERQPLIIPPGPNHTWSMDFVADALADGRPLKCLTVVDDCTKESVEIAVARRINGQGVAHALEAVCRFRGYPALIRTDQGPEFTGRALDQWASANGVRLMLTQPGKPTQNAYIESFNGKFRNECLNEHWFTSLEHARAVIGAWRRDYSEVRPHGAIGNQTPAHLAAALRETGCLRQPKLRAVRSPTRTLQSSAWHQDRGQVRIGRLDLDTHQQRPALRLYAFLPARTRRRVGPHHLSAAQGVVEFGHGRAGIARMQLNAYVVVVADQVCYAHAGTLGVLPTALGTIAVEDDHVAAMPAAVLQESLVRGTFRYRRNRLDDCGVEREQHVLQPVRFFSAGSQ